MTYNNYDYNNIKRIYLMAWFIIFLDTIRLIRFLIKYIYIKYDQ